jgi:hypothetical protein
MNMPEPDMIMPRKTVASIFEFSVTEMLGAAINDLLKIENENDAEAQNIEIRIADMRETQAALRIEGNRAYELRVKLEGMLR